MKEQRCRRCGKPTIATMMSMFNTQEVCMECIDAERQDPRYQEASNAEAAAIRGGNFNFKGIGR